MTTRAVCQHVYYEGMLLFLLITLVILLGFAVSGPLGAPWVPARKKDLQGIMEDFALRSGQLYIELGCGDGRLVAAAAKNGAKAIGYEINPLLFIIATIRNLRYPTAHIRFGNFWSKDLSRADAVMVFLMPKFMDRLEKKATEELKSGSKMICYVFPLPTKKPTRKRKSWTVYSY